MRGYVEMLERLEYFAPEGHEVTDAEIREALADQMAQRIDRARDEAKEPQP